MTHNPRNYRNPVGIKLLSGGEATEHVSITQALAAASSGDTVMIWPGTYAEPPLTIPAGVAVRGAIDGGTVKLDGFLSTGNRVVLSNGSSLHNMQITLPSDFKGAIVFDGGVGESAEVGNIKLIGNGANGYGVQVEGSGLFIADGIEYLSGACDVVVDIAGGSAILRNLSALTGTMEEYLVVNGGSDVGLLNFFVSDSVTATTHVNVVDATLTATNAFLSGATNAVRLGATHSVVMAASRLVGDTNDILVDPGVTDGSFQFLSGKFDARKFSADPAYQAQADVLVTFADDTAQDEGFNFWGEIHAGRPEAPKESVFGTGDSTTRGMVVFTTDNTASATTNGGNITDVTSDLTEPGDGNTATFQGTGVGHSIIVGTTLEDAGSSLLCHYGWKISQTTAATTDGAYIFEVSEDATNWTEVGVQANESSTFAAYSSDVFWRANSSEHLRYGVDSNTTWAAKTINSVEAKWLRVRITSAPTTLPVFDQFKVSYPRMELNSPGFLTAHGLAQWRATIFGAGNVWGDGGLGTASFPVGSGGAPTGWTHLMQNSSLNSTGDDLYWQIVLPAGICTAYPISIRPVYIYQDGSADPTGDASTVLSVIPIEVAGNLVADTAGGKALVARTQANTESTTAKAASTDTFTPPGTNRTTIQTSERGPFSIAGYYERDVICFRWTLLDDGTSSNNIEVLGIEIEGVRWTLGDKI